MQSQLNSDFSIEENVKNKLRNRIKLDYNIKNSKFNLVFSIESFYTTKSPSLSSPSFNQFRYIFGFNRPLTNQILINVNYLFKQDLDGLGNWGGTLVFRTKISYFI